MSASALSRLRSSRTTRSFGLGTRLGAVGESGGPRSRDRPGAAPRRAPRASARTRIPLGHRRDHAAAIPFPLLALAMLVVAGAVAAALALAGRPALGALSGAAEAAGEALSEASASLSATVRGVRHVVQASAENALLGAASAVQEVLAENTTNASSKKGGLFGQRPH